METFFYTVNNKEYPVHINRKRIKNSYYHFRDGAFEISCPPLMSKRQIVAGLDKYAKKIIRPMI